jgi:glycosyltransferase involved in cell wall biosynthesis
MHTVTVMTSVIVCTHNPRMDYLVRALSALKEQIFSKGLWELLLVDNACDKSIADRVDLSWQPNARHIKEDVVGLTHARIRGINESKGNLLIFVDDDNVLDMDYLERATQIAADYPQIGAFGASIKGEFEVAPPAWLTPFIGGLVVDELDRDYWSNIAEWSRATPYGAGMCVRRSVAEAYVAATEMHPIRKLLDRSGITVASGGDSDLVWTAIDLGMGTGRFTSLRLTHLIPKQRLTENYIVKLYSGFAHAGTIVDSLRSGAPPKYNKFKTRLRYWQTYINKKGVSGRIARECIKARESALRLMESIH